MESDACFSTATYVNGSAQTLDVNTSFQEILLYDRTAGNFVYATVEDGESVIVTIGAGVHTEKSLEDAINSIIKKKSDVENQLTQIKASYNEIVERLREIDRVVKTVM